LPTHLNGSCQVDINIGESSVEDPPDSVVAWKVDIGLVSTEGRQEVRGDEETVANLELETIPAEVGETMFEEKLDSLAHRECVDEGRRVVLSSAEGLQRRKEREAG